MTDALARLTPLGAMVLSMLGEGDMHPYEMIRLMRMRHDDRLVAITNGAMYHTVARLERAGLIAEMGVARAGNRPERTTYSRTDAGVDTIRRWLRHELENAGNPERFRIALSEAHNLERSEVLVLLRARRATLSAIHAAVVDELRSARASGVPDQYLLDIDRDQHLSAADLVWLDAFLERLESEDILWGPVSEPSDRYLAQREAARR